MSDTTAPVRCAACNRPVLPRDGREARMMRVRGIRWRCPDCVKKRRERVRRLERIEQHEKGVVTLKK